MKIQSVGDFYQGGEGARCRRVPDHFRVHVLTEARVDVTGRLQSIVAFEGVASRFLCGSGEDGVEARGELGLLQGIRHWDGWTSLYLPRAVMVVALRNWPVCPDSLKEFEV